MEYKKKKPLTRLFLFGGDGEIRTLEPLLTVTRFPIVRPRPARRHLRTVKALFCCRAIITDESSKINSKTQKKSYADENVFTVTYTRRVP